MVLSEPSGDLCCEKLKQKLSWTLEGLCINSSVIVNKSFLVTLQWSDWDWTYFQSVGFVSMSKDDVLGGLNMIRRTRLKNIVG